MTTSRLFWPADGSHRIAATELRSEHVPDVVQELLDDVHELAELADTIRSLEGSGGFSTSRAAAYAARQEAATLLLRAAESLPGPEAEVAAMRAAGLDGGDPGAAARRQAEVDEQDLVLLCGPTSTWRRKSSRTFFGAMASVPHAPCNDFVARVDACLPELLPYLVDTLSQPGLTVRPVPGFRVADLLSCGGEPDGFPKHFAYFLPEDEGLSAVTPAKTVVYANVYAMHHDRISRPLADRLLESCGGEWPDRPLEALLVWFRGHDYGHQLRLPQTALRELHVVGRETSIALQEALADVIGYLAMAGGPFGSRLGCDRALAGSMFLAEMLRYMQRRIGLFPDSDAAFFELSYLSSNGYVEIDPVTARVAWEPDSLHAGVTALARELVGAILDTDVTRTMALLAAHFPGEDAPLVDWWATHASLTSDVPTTFAYCTSRRGDRAGDEVAPLRAGVP